jgi:hypothetical protein
MINYSNGLDSGPGAGGNTFGWIKQVITAFSGHCFGVFACGSVCMRVTNEKFSGNYSTHFLSSCLTIGGKNPILVENDSQFLYYSRLMSGRI